MTEAIVYAARLPGSPGFRSTRYDIAPRICRDNLDYWRGLAALWQTPETIVNVEHDMEVSDALIADLVDCPHPLCTHAYRLYFPTTHSHDKQYAHNVSTVGWHPPIDDIGRYTARGIRWVGEGEEWADFSGIGFCKIVHKARVGPLTDHAWRWVEMSVIAAVEGRWHVHWPEVGHFHQ